MSNMKKMSCRKSGGRVDYTASNKVAAEAAEKATGGAVYEGGGSNVAKEAKEKRGGGAIMGAKSMTRKARGGATSSPFSSAGGGKASTSPFSSAKG